MIKVCSIAIATLIISIISGLLNPITYNYRYEPLLLFYKQKARRSNTTATIAIMTGDEAVNATLVKLKIMTGIDEIKSDVIAVFSSSINITVIIAIPILRRALQMKSEGRGWI